MNRCPTNPITRARTTFDHGFCIAPLVCLMLLCPLPACSTAASAGSHGAASPPAVQAHPGESKFIKLNFEKMPIPLLAKFFADQTGKHYVLEGVGTERIDLKLDHRVTIGEAERLFFAEIERRGYTVTTEGKTVRIADPRLPAPRPAATPR